MLYSTANNLMVRGQYLEATSRLQQVIDKATETNNQFMLSRAYSTIGSIFQRQGNSPQALEYKLSALHICEQSNDPIGIFNAHIDIADIKAALKLIQNSESDAYSMKVLKKIESSTNEEGKENVRSLIGYYKNKSVYSNWEEFEILFLQVNSDFYDKLNERFPSLTLNERKLCVFLKLNMTNKDIAQITFQSEEALKKARMRLRKKLEMDRDESLVSFIQSL